MSRRYPTATTPRHRNERLQFCIRCRTKLHGGKGSNIVWHQRDGRWKLGPMCVTCTNGPLERPPP